MKTKPKLKARRMWVNGYHGETSLYLHATKKTALRMAGDVAKITAVPVAVIPLDDVEALIEKAAIAIAKKRGYGPQYAPKFWLIARAALAAIGVLPKPRKQRH